MLSDKKEPLWLHTAALFFVVSANHWNRARERSDLVDKSINAKQVVSVKPGSFTKGDRTSPQARVTSEMAKLGTINLTGESKSIYGFTIYDRATQFQSFGAVYVMSRINDAGRYDIIYIGQTGDVSGRPLNHHKTSCFDTHGADKLLIRAEADESTRFDVETDLVRAYQPRCNG